MVGSLLAGLRPKVMAGLRRMRLRSEHVFELFRFDFLVDAWARPVLTEVRTRVSVGGVWACV